MRDRLPTMDPTERFSSRVDHYIRYRPSYPAVVIDVLRRDTGLEPTAIIADIGSGTGISTEMFLANGNNVFAVEPNEAMRAAAERQHASSAGFHSVSGTAEATTLPDASVDYVVAGQAFHWFDREKSRREFTRILRPCGWVVLMWNTRRVDTPFGQAYESLLREFGTDYERVRHESITPESLAAFFTPGESKKHVLPNAQLLDRDGLRGRLQSSSYVPQEGNPRYSPMLAALDHVFDTHEKGGVVPFDYNTELHIGRLA